MGRDPVLKMDPPEAGLPYVFSGCPLNDPALGSLFQRSVASHHYTEDQELPISLLDAKTDSETLSGWFDLGHPARKKVGIWKSTLVGEFDCFSLIPLPPSVRI